MVRKPAQKRSDGWVYVVQWKGRYWEAKIGFSTSLKQRLNDFLTYSSDILVVLKAFRADREKELELHVRFEGKRINGEWFKLDEGLKDFFKTRCPCDTRDARQEFGSFQKERIIWRPLILQASTRLENAHRNTNLPAFVNNARLYTLWTIQDLNDNDFLCTPNAIITHPTNNAVGDDWTVKVLYDEKTIYNRISSLAKDGLIVKGEDKLYALTDKGLAELEEAELKMMEHKEKRKSARSVCPRMP
jgi:hypothetical protein